MLIFLDLDEVLVDFTGGALFVHGWTRPQLEECRKLGLWDIVTPMGLTLKQFWEPIDKLGSEFWYQLQPLPWMESMLDAVTDEYLDADGIHVVTSPSRSPWSRIGKTQWIEVFLDDHIDSYHLLETKEVFATLPDAVLIDDRSENVRKFRKAGGEAVLFPSNGNTLYRYANDPVPYVAEQLKSLAGIQGDHNALNV